jgi:hypothetical protein
MLLCFRDRFFYAGGGPAAADFLTQHLVPALSVPIVLACTALTSPPPSYSGHPDTSRDLFTPSPLRFTAIEDAGLVARTGDLDASEASLARSVAGGLLLLMCEHCVDVSPAAPAMVTLLSTLLEGADVCVSPAARYAEEKVCGDVCVHVCGHLCA